MPERSLKILRAGLLACFFFPLCTVGQNHSWRFDPETDAVYKLVVNLQTEQAFQRLKKFTDPSKQNYRIYLESLAECIDILVSENEAKFELVEENFKQRIRQLEDQKETAETLFLQAELYLQRGFCHLNLGHNWSAIFDIRNAYQLTEECLEKFPSYIPVRKTSGVLQVMVGAVPDKYHWFMSLLGMEGSVKKGQQQLQELGQAGLSLSIEANVLYYTIKGFINQQFAEASAGMAELIKGYPDNRLLGFIAINMMVKNDQSEEALALIKKVESNPRGLPLVYLDYLLAEIYLQKGEYAQAITTYQKFMGSYKGSSFKKDATMKISLCYHLQGKKDLATKWWQKARNTGKNVAEPDIYADHMLKEDQLPNEKLLRIRFLTDGGYYEEAGQLIAPLTMQSFKDSRDKVELIYRKARLAQKTGQLTTAQSLYLRAIELTGNETWYFAPSSALQLGYIFLSRGKFFEAKEYFNKALSYKRHAYKNSIDGKAKSALDQLSGKF